MQLLLFHGARRDRDCMCVCARVSVKGAKKQLRELLGASCT